MTKKKRIIISIDDETYKMLEARKEWLVQWYGQDVWSMTKSDFISCCIWYRMKDIYKDILDAKDVSKHLV